jgi:hypothetical protein
MHALAALLFVVALPVAATEAASWPPPDAVVSRMHELQGVISGPESAPRSAGGHRLATS